MRFSIHKEIGAPAEKVFELITSDDKMKQWMPHLVSITYPGGIPLRPAPGVRFVQKLKEGVRVSAYECRITAYERDKLFALTMGNHAFTANIRYKLASAGETTILDYDCDVKYQGWFYGLIGKWFFKYMVRMAEEQVNNIKKIAEQ